MKKFLTEHKKWLLPGSFLMVLVGLALMWLGLRQPVTVVVDGEATRIRTSAVTVNGALRVAGVSAGPDDRVVPSRGRLFWKSGVIQVTTAREVTVRTPEYEVVFTSAEPIPANLVLESDILLYPHDRLLINGEVADPEASLESVEGILLQYLPAIPVTLEMDEEELTFYTGEETLGEALSAAGIETGPDDWISESLSTLITEPITVKIRQARMVTVITQGTSMTGLTAAPTVGEALLDLGVPLQNLDYSLPAEGEPVPADGQITVVSVHEEIKVVTEEITHQYEYQEDPDTTLDKTSVVQEGQDAIFAVRERTHYEDGEEVWRISEDTWQASEQRTEIIGYGSQIVVQTASVDGQTLEYFRKLTVYVTSYKPCDYAGNCWYYTSSGLPVEKGVIAVPYSWYLLMQGQQVYVTGYGYGVIADVCGGCVGMAVPWIDVGYSEENYDALHIPNGYYTMYFLTPVPAYVPSLLP
jgi:uncharacterized protein YabE (DUF348 family)